MKLTEHVCNKVVFYKGKNFNIVMYGFLYAVAALVVSQEFFILWIMFNGQLSFNFALYISIVIPLSIVVFSKLIYIFYNFKRFLATPLEVLNETGYAFFGGLIGIIFSVYFAHILYPGINVYTLLDMLFLSMPLGQVFQRIGCLTYGCCYGDSYNGPLAIQYTNPQSKAYRFIGDAPVHPTQLYSVLKNIAIMVILFAVFSVLPYQGLTFALWLILYSLLRFFIDFTRYTRDIYLFGFRYSQYFSIIFFAIGIYLLTQVQPNSYQMVNPFHTALINSLIYLPFSFISFFIFFISYGYHSKKLGFYTSKGD